MRRSAGHCGHDECAISIAQVAVIGICCCCSQLWTPADALVTEENIYEDLSRSFDGNFIRLIPDLQFIIERVFERLQCGNPHDPLQCIRNQCLRADNVFEFAGYLPTPVLTPKTLLGVSVPIMVYASNLMLYCNSSLPTKDACALSSSSQEKSLCWTNRLLSSGNNLKQKDVDTMLSRLAQNIDDDQNSSEVMNATVILQTDLQIRNNSGITKEKIPLFSAYLLTKLFQGAAFASPRKSRKSSNTPESTSRPPLVTSNAFIDSIFDNGEIVSLQRIRDIMRHLHIGSSSHLQNDTDVGGATSHNRARRQAEVNASISARNLTNTCWPLEMLIDTDSIKKDSLTKAEFSAFCPTMIQQAYSGVCARQAESHPEVAALPEKITDAQKYGYGTISVVVISLLGLLGVVFFPLVNRKIYNYTLQGFIALGVGTLCGDAMLHLLPEALNVRDDADNADLEKKEEKEHLVLWRCVACLAALYAFFLWEISLHYFIRYRAAKGKDRQHLEEDNHDHSHIPDQAVFAKARAANEKSEMEMAHNCSETSSGQVHAHVHQPETLLGLSPLAWMILIGDTIHNFGDGMTIAAAFSQNVRSGVGTSIAIFTHEIPHELGDFAILLSTGMPFKRAVLLNFITALACVLGFYVGVPVAAYESARQWIFTVAAGMFLYVALADMLPELKHGAKNLPVIALQNLGLLTGVGIMILMALYEDAIQI